MSWTLSPHTLRYLNRKTKELVPEAEPGRPCYEVRGVL